MKAAPIPMLKRIMPTGVKSLAKDTLVNWKLRRAVKDIHKLPAGEMPTTEMLVNLQIGWNNDGYVARTGFLSEVARQALTTSGPILECGSGLTSLIVGLLAGKRGVKTYSLEHMSEWRDRVNTSLNRCKIPNVQVELVSLKEYDGFTWYDAPLTTLPKQFALAICDGPPGHIKGGRYGLLPLLGARLSTGSVILLDDTERAGEAEVLRRWQTESSLSVVFHETANGSYAVITKNDTTQPEAGTLPIVEAPLGIQCP
jgi:hypothetical protein